MVAKWLWTGLLGLVSMSMISSFCSASELNPRQVSCVSDWTDITGKPLRAQFTVVASMLSKTPVKLSDSWGIDVLVSSKDGHPIKLEKVLSFSEIGYKRGTQVRKIINLLIKNWQEENKAFDFGSVFSARPRLRSYQAGLVVPKAIAKWSDYTLLIGYSNARNRFSKSFNHEGSFQGLFSHVFVFERQANGKLGLDALKTIVDLNCGPAPLY